MLMFITLLSSCCSRGDRRSARGSFSRVVCVFGDPGKALGGLPHEPRKLFSLDRHQLP